ncbi:MAG: hypothetical protein UT34_C0002G0317 [candidate division WS6 bacterium GW2011_GWF2_39_15]|uniref:Uncharacterized protein n=1 Tax=candidate division WS6 bacterium GW2011_GWF2_39_15 TaxID=1619100 RepID=A0A0G0Q5X0_9BACT|nr:MAG: hypothetical protein UT34_C0002G0317 [candidate division WS6 bacterium GW2011_GWF2_39_15]
MFIDIIVKTKQKEANIEKLETGGYKVSVKALPTKNKANLELIDLISNYFNVTKSQVKIKSGKYSSQKKVYIDDQIRIPI